ncbi:MAG: NAD-dependent epimerase/dehydratase family protein [Parvularcula sp.]
MTGAAPIMVTGATGFLGRKVVDELVRCGISVLAVSRQQQPEEQGVFWIKANLSRDSGMEMIASELAEKKPSGIIHLAGLMQGTDPDHVTHTVKPTRRIVEALRRLDRPEGDLPELVLASSFSVYSYTGQPTGSLLDETTPTEIAAHRRDAYARAKLAQEAIVRSAAQRDGMRVRVLRPGAIVGEGRNWTARIGMQKGPVVVLLGGRAPLPLIDVEACARAFALAAITPLQHSDVYCADGGAMEIINVVGDEQPDQKSYLSMLRSRGLNTAKLAVPVPWKALEKGSELVGIGMDLSPWLEKRVPGFLKPETLHARAKPLRYSNARLRDRLGWRPTGTK